jgi:DNA polymerase-1
VQAGSLKALMRRHGLGEYVTEVTAEDTLAMSTTDPAFERYAMTDALAALMETWAEGEAADLEGWLARENRVAAAARAMTARGVRVDRGKLGELETRFLNEKAEAEKIAKELEPDVENVGSPDQIVDACERRGIELPTTRRKRRDGWTYYSPSTSRKDLASDDPFVLAFQRYRSKAAAATYVRELAASAGDDGRLRTRWKTLGARSSRWSSSKPNLQNVAKHGEHVEVRSAFRPAPGLVFVQADLSQIEYRVAAALSGDPEMLRAFEEGGDLHVHAARVLNGVDEPTSAQRSAAKAIGFGKLYGQQIAGAAKATGVSEEEMARRVAEYDDTFPVLAEWCRDVEAETRTGGGTTPVTPYGRRFPVPGAYAGVNYLCQSTARELFVDWLLAVDTEYPGAVVLAVHDEIVLEVDPAEAEAVAARVAALAEEANERRPAPLERVRIVAESTVVAHDWMEAYR